MRTFWRIYAWLVLGSFVFFALGGALASTDLNSAGLLVAYASVLLAFCWIAITAVVGLVVLAITGVRCTLRWRVRTF